MHQKTHNDGLFDTSKTFKNGTINTSTENFLLYINHGDMYQFPTLTETLDNDTNDTYIDIDDDDDDDNQTTTITMRWDSHELYRIT